MVFPATRKHKTGGIEV